MIKIFLTKLNFVFLKFIVSFHRAGIIFDKIYTTLISTLFVAGSVSFATYLFVESSTLRLFLSYCFFVFVSTGMVFGCLFFLYIILCLYFFGVPGIKKSTNKAQFKKLMQEFPNEIEKKYFLNKNLLNIAKETKDIDEQLSAENSNPKILKI